MEFLNYMWLIVVADKDRKDAAILSRRNGNRNRIRLGMSG